MTVDQLELEVLKLPERDREHLAQRLIASLDPDAQLLQAWFEDDEAGALGPGGDDDWVPPDVALDLHWP